MALKQQEELNDDCWFPDSGASHHVTNDLGSLTIGSEYTGGGKVSIGNGSGLSIPHIGSSVLNSHTSHSSHIFHLHDLLRVPNITKNLISLSKFAQDNNVFFEFHHRFCVVKDLATQTPLLQGSLHKGLYRFHLNKHVPPSPPSAASLSLSSVSLPSSHPQNQVLKSHSIPEVASSTLSRWHYRVGHPSFSTAKQILTNCNTPFSRNDNITLCSACELGKNHRLPFSHF